MKKLQYLSYLISLLWILNGIITIGSIILSTIGWVINVTLGTIFIFIAFYVFFKEKSFILLLKNTNAKINIKKSAIQFEVFFLVVILLIGMMAFSGIIIRVFSENFAVFG